MKKNFERWVLLMSFVGILGISTSAAAVCPICVFVAGAGIGLAEWLGIDTSIAGIWVGGLTVALIIWTITWLDKKNIHFHGRKILVVIIFYLLIIPPLYFTGFSGSLLNKMWGIDKIVLGIILGSVVFFVGHLTSVLLKKHHQDKAYFPFQKVVLPILPLVFLSVIFYYLNK